MIQYSDAFVKSFRRKILFSTWTFTVFSSSRSSQLEPEGGALTDLRLDAVSRVVHLEYALDDGQTEPGAGNRAPMRLIDLVISIPDIFQIFSGYALSVIGDFYADYLRAVLLPYDLAHLDELLPARMRYRVVDEIVDDL